MCIDVQRKKRVETVAQSMKGKKKKKKKKRDGTEEKRKKKKGDLQNDI